MIIPMSPYMARSDFAYETFLIDAAKLSEQDQHCMRVLLQHHPKVAGHMVAVSKVKGRSNTDGFFYEQRISLPRKVRHQFAAASDGDEIFYGKKFVEYPDGSVFLHLELLCKQKDNYIPEERLLDPSLMRTAAAAAASATAGAMEVNGGARVLAGDFEGGAARKSVKRAATAQDRVGSGNGGDTGRTIRGKQTTYRL